MTDLNTAQRCADVMMANDRSSQALGISIEIPAPGTAIARMTVSDEMLNGFDVLHGGVMFALADTAFAFACNAYDNQSFAASAQIEFVRPARLGDALMATANEEYRGRRNSYYSVAVSNQDDERVALFRGRSVSNGRTLIK